MQFEFIYKYIYQINCIDFVCIDLIDETSGHIL